MFLLTPASERSLQQQRVRSAMLFLAPMLVVLTIAAA